jgi:tetratricopeptide (TPR) repeat protein
MKGIIQAVSLTILTLAVVATISAQDLGSANKLFGESKQPSNGGKKPVPKKKTTTNRHSTTAGNKSAIPSKLVGKKAPNRIKVKKNPAAESEGKKLIANPPLAKGAKITKGLPSPADTSTRARFSGKVETQAGSKQPETKISPADEARFEDLIEQGNSARDDRDYARAETAYKNARAIKARDARAIYGLGNIYSDQQRWEEAENAYRAALQLEPSSAMTYVALSYVLTQPLAVANLSDRYAEAEKLARRATELSPRNALAFDQLGVAMEMRGQMGAETENIYRKAVALDPTFAPAYAHLGRLLRRRGMIDQSKEAYREAIERSTDVGTTVLVAEVMQSEQHYADSLPLLKQALEADPRNPSALLMFGHALIVTGQYKDAESTLQKALTVGSNGYQADLLLASLYMRQGAYELAENALLQALRWAPAYENRQLAQQFVMLGQGYSKTGKSQQSQRAYSQAAKLDPDSGTLSGRFRQ